MRGRNREVRPATRLGLALRLARHSSGETVQALALRLEISRGRLSEYETGAITPSSASLERLLEALPEAYHSSIRIAALEDQLAELERRVLVVRSLLRDEFPVQVVS